MAISESVMDVHVRSTECTEVLSHARNKLIRPIIQFCKTSSTERRNSPERKPELSTIHARGRTVKPCKPLTDHHIPHTCAQ